MDLNNRVDVYGFGSAFKSDAEASDTDILIVHASLHLNSCQLAIRVKASLIGVVPNVDVTILSSSEESHFSFVEQSNASLLGIVRAESYLRDIERIVVGISSRQREGNN